MLEGSCHCGAVTVRLETAKAPAELPVRVCGCTFCAKHRPRYTSDPGGRLIVSAAREADLLRYRFGLALADFLICARCGVFVAAVEPGPEGRGVLNLEVLARAGELSQPETRFEAYDSEDAATRGARRAKAWTPARIELGGVSA